MEQETSYGQIVGQVIRGRREMQGINLLTMAESVALASASGWSRVETGETTMTVSQLRKAAKKLGMTPGNLIAQADVIAAQLEATGIAVHDDKPKSIGKWLLGGAGILALVAAGAAAANSRTSKSQTNSTEDDKVEDK